MHISAGILFLWVRFATAESTDANLQENNITAHLSEWMGFFEIIPLLLVILDFSFAINSFDANANAA